MSIATAEQLAVELDKFKESINDEQGKKLLEVTEGIKESHEKAMAEKNKAMDAIDIELADLKKKIAALSENEPINREHTSNNSAGRDKKYIPIGDHLKGKGLEAARLCRYLAQAKGDHRQALQTAEHAGDKRMVDAFTKIISADNFAGAGSTIPEAFMPDIIELLQASSVFRTAGPFIVPMPNGNITIPRITSAMNATWQGETDLIIASDPTTGNINLQARKLTSLTAVSNDLIAQSPLSADQWVRDLMIRTMANTEELAFLRGDGTVSQPKGIRSTIIAANLFDRTQAGAFSTVDEITADLLTATKNVQDADVTTERPVFFIRKGTFIDLMGKRDGNGNLIFADMLRAGNLFGIPVVTTNNIPKNLGGGAETEVYYVEMSEAIVADTRRLVVDIFPNGAYSTSGGVVSGISQDSTVIRAINEVDFSLQHPEAASVIEMIDWEKLA